VRRFAGPETGWVHRKLTRILRRSAAVIARVIRLPGRGRGDDLGTISARWLHDNRRDNHSDN
jgi:hypothetical protein